jgi:CHAT domain-containing protein
VESRITPGRLLVIDADDGLAGLPFEALVDAQGRYLADRFSITASRGIYYRSDNRAQISVTSGSTALIIAVPTSSADAMQTLTPLPDALAEADAVASGFSNTSVLRASQVTADAIAANLPSAQVFHFAGHAVLSARHSGLLLADSFLSAADLRKMSLRNLRLAVLSACQTQDGSGGDGLVRVFLAAGVPDVVASRWSVNSAATREFMDFFYRNLLAGHSVADSIRQAQISLRSRRGMSHPFYWAAFTSFGSV